MGWEAREIRINGHVSKHNSYRDAVDEILWKEVCRQIREIVNNSDFENLRLLMDWEEDEEFES